MTKEDARYYLRSSGFSEEQIDTIEQALSQVTKEWSEMLVMCDNCGHAIHIKNEDYEQEPCDAISRQAVIDTVERWLSCDDYNEAERHIMRAVQSVLYDLPSVKPQEPKTGHWTHDGSHWENRFICSECGYKLFDEQTNYCPNCGARMESEE